LFAVRLNFIFLHSQVSEQKNKTLEMYAIVDIAGQQIKVQKDQKIYVNRLEGKEGSKIDFDQILLIDDDGKVQVGTPVIKDMVVSATIVSHLKGDKVKVFKKKRRKGYKVLNGHRQLLTELLIENIAAGKAKAPEKKAEAKPKETEKTSEGKKSEPKAAAPKKESKPAAKAAGKSAGKKSAAPSKSTAKAKSTKASGETKTGKEAKEPAKQKATTAKKAQTAKPKKPAGDKKEK
jgi:large subunit ribosomal protein L21